MRRTADAGEEGGLEEARNAEGGGDEDDAQGGVGTDKEVLCMHCQLFWGSVGSLRRKGLRCTFW